LEEIQEKREQGLAAKLPGTLGCLSADLRKRACQQAPQEELAAGRGGLEPAQQPQRDPRVIVVMSIVNE